MKTNTGAISGALLGIFSVLFGGEQGSVAGAAVITSSDIRPIPGNVQSSGNGTLDLRLFTSSGSDVGNSSGSFDGDNANTQTAQGGGRQFAESYVTTAGDLQDYYDLNFGPGVINQLALFLDLNETGGGSAINTLNKLTIILNPSSINGSPNPAADISSNAQNGTNQSYTGGTVLATLTPEPADNLPLNAQGAGWADYIIFTGVDVYALAASDVLLLNVSMSDLNNGGEELFLSGLYSPDDVEKVIVPAPGSVLGTIFAAGMFWLRRPKVRTALAQPA